MASVPTSPSRPWACRPASSCAPRSSGRVAAWPTSGSTAMPATLHLESLWIRDVTVTTGLVDTCSTPTLLRLLTSGQLDGSQFVTHHFELDQMLEAYDAFGRAAETGALKVVHQPVAAWPREGAACSRPSGSCSLSPEEGADLRSDLEILSRPDDENLDPRTCTRDFRVRRCRTICCVIQREP